MSQWQGNDDQLWAVPRDHQPNGDRTPSFGYPARNPGDAGLPPADPFATPSDTAAFVAYLQPPVGWVKPVRTLSRFVIALIALTTVTGVYLFTTLRMQADLVSRVAAGERFTHAELVAVDERVVPAVVLNLALLVATAVVFVVWFWRIRSNAGVMAGHLQRRTQGWAFWGWMVPIVSFWFPVQIAVDAVRSAPEQPRSRLTLTVIGWWWVFWVAASVLGTVLARLPEPATLEGLATHIAWESVSEILWWVAAVPAVAVVVLLTDLQEPRPATAAAVGSTTRP